MVLWQTNHSLSTARKGCVTGGALTLSGPQFSHVGNESVTSQRQWMNSVVLKGLGRQVKVGMV